MKKKFTIGIFLPLLLLMQMRVFGQNQGVKIEGDKGKLSNLIKEAPVIMQGEVLNIRKDTLPDYTKVNHTYTVKVSGIFKGALSIDTIDIVQTFYYEGLLPDGTYRIVNGCFGEPTFFGAIVLGKEATFLLENQQQSTYQYKAHFGIKYERFYSNNGYVTGPYGFKSFDLDSFYDYLNKYKRVKVPKELYISEKVRVNQEKMDAHLELVKKKLKKSDSGANFKAVSGTPSLNVFLENQRYETHNNKLEFVFDVLASSTEASYLDNLTFRLTYNQSKFGSNIHGAGNVRYEAISELNAYNFVFSDHPGKVYITTSPNFLNPQRTLLNTSKKKLFSVFIVVTNYAQLNAQLTFVETNESSNQCFYSETSTSADVYLYDNVNYSKNSSEPSFPQPSISTIVASNSLVAGNDETIKIQGTNFGPQDASTQVFFVDVDDPNFGYQTYFDQDDILSWSDTEVIVKVPSKVVSNPDAFADHGAGSGKVKLKTVFGEIESVESVEIKKSYTNVNLNSAKQKFYSAKASCINGVEFTLSEHFSTVSQIKDAVPVIEQALADWSLQAGVDLRLKKDNQGNIIYDVGCNGGTSTTDNCIYITNIPGKAMLTTSDVTTCSSNNKAVRVRTKIAIDPSSDFQYSDGYLAPNMDDFYGAFIHEIGHVLGVNHIYDTQEEQLEFMHPKTLNGGATGVGASNRPQLNPTEQSRQDSRDAGVNLINESKSFSWQCSPYSDFIPVEDTKIEITANGSTDLCPGKSVVLNSSNTTAKWIKDVNGTITEINNTSSNLLVVDAATYYKKYVDNSGCVYYSNKIVITSKPSPLINTQPNDINVCDDTPANFSTTVLGLNLDYQWYVKSKNGSTFNEASSIFRYSGGQSPNLEVKRTVNYDGYTYYCEITNEFGCTSTTNIATLNVDKISLDLAETTVFSNASPIPLSGGYPLSGIYSGTSVSSNTFNPSVGEGTYTITYEKDGCRRNAKDDIRVLQCSGSCKAITIDKISRGYFCFGGNAYLSFNVDYSTAGNLTQSGNLIVQLSNAFGSFSNPTTIGTTSYSNSGTIACTIPSTTTPGFNYRIRVVSTANADAQSEDNGTGLRVYPLHQNCSKILISVSRLLTPFKSGLIVYPNPTTGILTAFSETINEDEPLLVSLYDSFGNLVLEQMLDKPTSIIDISHLSDGLYLLKYEMDNEIKSERIILSKQ